ncbi:hypothetical protein FF38_03485 [Lucilia cuprina]|uniref:Uncharacterized protein n=1 Tax=Lucilia cuprina TaxID=7375 RepID=A0A0L0BNL3_LUCCU|nr:hypothetical protein FF38_03485 [Lucilia cuprina]
MYMYHLHFLFCFRRDIFIYRIYLIGDTIPGLMVSVLFSLLIIAPSSLSVSSPLMPSKESKLGNCTDLSTTIFSAGFGPSGLGGSVEALENVYLGLKLLLALLVEWLWNILGDFASQDMRYMLQRTDDLQPRKTHQTLNFPALTDLDGVQGAYFPRELFYYLFCDIKIFLRTGGPDFRIAAPYAT